MRVEALILAIVFTLMMFAYTEQERKCLAIGCLAFICWTIYLR